MLHMGNVSDDIVFCDPQGADGERVEYGVGDGWEDGDRVGYFGIPVDVGEAR